MELGGVFAEGFLDGEGIVFGDVEGEGAGLSIMSGCFGYASSFRIVEDDVGVAMGDVGIEPGEAAARELDVVGVEGLDDCVAGGDVALELVPDLADILFEACGQGCEEGHAEIGDDTRVVLGAAVVFGRLVVFRFDVLSEVLNPIFCHAFECSSVVGCKTLYLRNLRQVYGDHGFSRMCADRLTA